MNWKINDRAIVIVKTSIHYGKETTVTAIGAGGIFNGQSFLGCEVDLPCVRKDYDYCVFRYTSLKYIPYDGNNASTWHECDFKPAVPVEVES